MKMRVAASVAVTALTALALTGCQFVTPQQTARSYTPADGINSHIGAVQIRNVFLVTADGETASMIGVLSNTAASARTVTLQYSTDDGLQSTDVTVPGDGLVSLRTDAADQTSASVTTRADAVVLDGVNARPGGLFRVGFSSGSADPITLQVPVLNGSIDGYRTLIPTPEITTPEATPTDSSSPGVTDLPSPSATP